MKAKRSTPIDAITGTEAVANPPPAALPPAADIAVDAARFAEHMARGIVRPQAPAEVSMQSLHVARDGQPSSMPQVPSVTPFEPVPQADAALAGAQAAAGQTVLSTTQEGKSGAQAGQVAGEATGQAVASAVPQAQALAGQVAQSGARHAEAKSAEVASDTASQAAGLATAQAAPMQRTPASRAQADGPQAVQAAQPALRAPDGPRELTPAALSDEAVAGDIAGHVPAAVASQGAAVRHAGPHASRSAGSTAQAEAPAESEAPLVELAADAPAADEAAPVAPAFVPQQPVPWAPAVASDAVPAAQGVGSAQPNAPVAPTLEARLSPEAPPQAEALAIEAAGAAPVASRPHADTSMEPNAHANGASASLPEGAVAQEPTTGAHGDSQPRPVRTTGDTAPSAGDADPAGGDMAPDDASALPTGPGMVLTAKQFQARAHKRKVMGLDGGLPGQQKLAPQAAAAQHAPSVRSDEPAVGSASATAEAAAARQAVPAAQAPERMPAADAVAAATPPRTPVAGIVTPSDVGVAVRPEPIPPQAQEMDALVSESELAAQAVSGEAKEIEEIETSEIDSTDMRGAPPAPIRQARAEKEAEEIGAEQQAEAAHLAKLNTPDTLPLEVLKAL